MKTARQAYAASHSTAAAFQNMSYQDHKDAGHVPMGVIAVQKIVHDEQTIWGSKDGGSTIGAQIEAYVRQTVGRGELIREVKVAFEDVDQFIQATGYLRDDRGVPNEEVQREAHMGGGMSTDAEPAYRDDDFAR